MFGWRVVELSAIAICWHHAIGMLALHRWQSGQLVQQVNSESNLFTNLFNTPALLTPTPAQLKFNLSKFIRLQLFGYPKWIPNTWWIIVIMLSMSPLQYFIGQFLPQHVGIPLGGKTGAKFYMLEIHYDNPHSQQCKFNNLPKATSTQYLLSYKFISAVKLLEIIQVFINKITLLVFGYLFQGTIILASASITVMR